MPCERFVIARSKATKQSMLAAVLQYGLLRGVIIGRRFAPTRRLAMTAVYDGAVPAKISAETGANLAKSHPRPGAASSSARV
jgi:hypothetical protein